jgi:YHS domain-containing protein
MFKDPVCNMMVDEKTAEFVSEVEGERRYTSALQHASKSLMQIQENMAIESSL